MLDVPPSPFRIHTRTCTDTRAPRNLASAGAFYAVSEELGRAADDVTELISDLQVLNVRRMFKCKCYPAHGACQRQSIKSFVTYCFLISPANTRAHKVFQNRRWRPMSPPWLVAAPLYNCRSVFFCAPVAATLFTTSGFVGLGCGEGAGVIVLV